MSVPGTETPRLHSWWGEPPIPQLRCPGRNRAEQILRASVSLAYTGNLDGSPGPTTKRWPWTYAALGMFERHDLLMLVVEETDLPLQEIRTFLLECQKSADMAATTSEWYSRRLGMKLAQCRPDVIQVLALGFSRLDPNCTAISLFQAEETEWDVPRSETSSNLEKVLFYLQWLRQFSVRLGNLGLASLVVPTAFLAAFRPDSIYPYALAGAEYRTELGVHRSAFMAAFESASVHDCAHAAQIREILRDVDDAFTAFLGEPQAESLAIRPGNNPVSLLRTAADAVNVELAFQFIVAIRERIWKAAPVADQTGKPGTQAGNEKVAPAHTGAVATTPAQAKSVPEANTPMRDGKPPVWPEYYVAMSLDKIGKHFGNSKGWAQGILEREKKVGGFRMILVEDGITYALKTWLASARPKGNGTEE